MKKIQFLLFSALLLMIFISCEYPSIQNSDSISIEKAMDAVDSISAAANNSDLIVELNNNFLTATGTGWSFVIDQTGNLTITFVGYDVSNSTSGEYESISGVITRTVSGIAYNITLTGAGPISKVQIEFDASLNIDVFIINDIDRKSDYDKFLASRNISYNSRLEIQ